MNDPIPPRTRLPRPLSQSQPDREFWGEPRGNGSLPPRPRMSTGLDALRERFDEWRADTRFGVIAMVLVAVIAGVVWYRVGVSGGNEPSAAKPSRTAAVDTTQAAVPPTTVGNVVVVHVAGAVVTPGVVELPAGSRVIDAIEAAGGGTLVADFDQLNLAAKLVDGERVLVPKLGQVAPIDPTTDSSAGSSSASAGPINLNTATAAQLEELPGIGPALAAAIIDERDRRGGFRSINELREVRGIGEKRFADLRDHVTV